MYNIFGKTWLMVMLLGKLFKKIVQILFGVGGWVKLH